MRKFLPPALVVGIVGFAVGQCAAADSSTAYTAMRLVGKTLGEDSMSRVVEMTGRGGTPQPETWRIVLSDGRAIDVAGDRIVGQKNVGHVASAQSIKLQDLNLDSSGAFDAVNGQARTAHVPFASLNYALRVNTTTGKPVWDIDLFNQSARRVASVRLAAHDGNIIASTGFAPGQSTASTTTIVPSSTRAPELTSNSTTEHDNVRPTRVPPVHDTETTTTYETARTESDDDSGGGFFARVGRTLDHTNDAIAETLTHTGRAVDRTVRHTGVRLQRFFTGDSDSRD